MTIILASLLFRSALLGILSSVEWQFLTDVSGQHIGPIFKDQVVQGE
jgi:hypothetical protein